MALPAYHAVCRADTPGEAAVVALLARPLGGSNLPEAASTKLAKVGGHNTH